MSATAAVPTSITTPDTVESASLARQDCQSAPGRCGSGRGRPSRQHRGALVVLALGALVLSACGESEEEKALKTVCDTRADIQQKVKSLGALTPSTASADQIEQDLQAIRGDVETIANARGDLAEETKKQVETANQEFRSQVEAIATDVKESQTGGGDAEAALASALGQLEAAYRTAYQPVDCSGA